MLKVSGCPNFVPILMDPYGLEVGSLAGTGQSDYNIVAVLDIATRRMQQLLGSRDTAPVVGLWGNNRWAPPKNGSVRGSPEDV